VKCKEAKAALAKQATDCGRENAATGHPAAPKEQRPGSSAEKMDLGERLLERGWSARQGARTGAFSQPAWCRYLSLK